MLIINEFRVKGIIGQQYYGLTFMIILYILSIMGCILIAIVLLKFILLCFFNEKNLLFCNNSNKNDSNKNLKKNDKNSPFSQQGMMETVNNLENILLKVS
jgi:hypothetical protein